MLTPAFYPSLERHDAASRTDDGSQLTDDQWFVIEDLFEWQPPTRAGERDVERIAPHRKNRKKPPTQDGRKLRRLNRARWRIERTNAWFQSYGRIAIRKDRLGMLFLGWTQLACLFTILKRF